MLSDWAGGTLHDAVESREVTGVSTDTRTMERGNLYVALRGEHFDGHHFVGEAMAKGAAGVLVQDASALHGHPGIVVRDTLWALGEMAHQYRWQGHLIPWIGVTGSNGKTTTRSMITHILSSRGDVCHPEKNYNNLIGMPLTILSCQESDQYGVLELGTSAPGEIPRLTDIATPTVSVVTSVSAAHLEGLGTCENIAHEKGSIFDRLLEDGVAIYPAQDPYVDILESHVRGNQATFSVDGPADMVAENIACDSEGVRFIVRGVPFRLNLLGRHNVSNCLAALLAVEHLGIGLEEAAEALEGMPQLEGRIERLTRDGLTVLSDEYNANPGSLRAGVETLLGLEARRRVVIVGDMLELGPESKRLHAEVGTWISRSGVDVLLTVGRETLALAEGAAGMCARLSVRHFRTAQALIGILPELVAEGDVVLVKGSRGMRMERIVQALRMLQLA